MSFVPSDETIDLEKAIELNLIKVEFVSNGSYSGSSLKMNVNNLNSKRLVIRVKEGTYFAAPNDEEQNLLVPQEELIVLEPKSSKEHVLNGFCTNMSLSAPESGGLFKLSKPQIKGLAEFLVLVKGKKLENYTLQSAIWALTDNEEVSNVDGENQADVDLIRKELFKIAGQKETWYKSRQEYAIADDRSINTETLAINGKLSFQTVKGAIIHEEIYSSEGKLLFKLPETTTKLGGIVEYEFNLKVKGWKKGDYEVRLMDNNKLVKTFDFKV